MTFGVCCGLDKAAIAADAGFEYVELSVGAVLMPRESDDAFGRSLDLVHASPLPVKAVNVFAPADLRLTGPGFDLAVLETYATAVCRRAQQAGILIVVLGSGGARTIPDGFSHESAHAQFVAFCRMLGPIAQARGVTIGIEALNPMECNFITRIADADSIAIEVDHSAIRLTADGYHWAKAVDSADDLAAAVPRIAHTHIATWPNRFAPGAEDCDFGVFFRTLKRAGYHGAMSVEANLRDAQAELPRALAAMKAAWSQA